MSDKLDKFIIEFDAVSARLVSEYEVKKNDYKKTFDAISISSDIFSAGESIAGKFLVYPKDFVKNAESIETIGNLAKFIYDLDGKKKTGSWNLIRNGSGTVINTDIGGPYQTTYADNLPSFVKKQIKDFCNIKLGLSYSIASVDDYVQYYADAKEAKDLTAKVWLGEFKKSFSTWLIKSTSTGAQTMTLDSIKSVKEFEDLLSIYRPDFSQQDSDYDYWSYFAARLNSEILYYAVLEKDAASSATEAPLSATQSQMPAVPKIKLNIVGIEDGFQVMARQDLPDFKIYVGDIPIVDNLNRSNDYDNFEDSEYIESDYGADEEEKLVFDGEVMIAFSDSELSRDGQVSAGNGVGVNKGDDKVVTPGAAVPDYKVVLGAFAGVRNSSIMTKQSKGQNKIEIADFITPSGEKISKSEIIKNINEFVADVLAPFAAFLKDGYPDLYKNWIVTSTTRAYVPKGGSTTSQHFRGQAFDSQILGATTKNPDGNIRLLNAILTWYGKNPVGYGQILFETRGNSCWVHWSYKRGNSRLMLARFKEDSTLNVPANTVGKYVLPPLNSKSLGFA